MRTSFGTPGDMTKIIGTADAAFTCESAHRLIDVSDPLYTRCFAACGSNLVHTCGNRGAHCHSGFHNRENPRPQSLHVEQVISNGAHY